MKELSFNYAILLSTSCHSMTEVSCHVSKFKIYQQELRFMKKLEGIIEVITGGNSNIGFVAAGEPSVVQH
ncbi:hypothetical protein BH18THE2_BH18THE2_07710 [soil metagenome]